MSCDCQNQLDFGGLSRTSQLNSSIWCIDQCVGSHFGDIIACGADTSLLSTKMSEVPPYEATLRAQRRQNTCSLSPAKRQKMHSGGTHVLFQVREKAPRRLCWGRKVLHPFTKTTTRTAANKRGSVLCGGCGLTTARLGCVRCDVGGHLVRWRQLPRLYIIPRVVRWQL